jgi:hypothetical protein
LEFWLKLCGFAFGILAEALRLRLWNLIALPMCQQLRLKTYVIGSN